jgi:uncharacterized protein (TIGR03435 family)
MNRHVASNLNLWMKVLAATGTAALLGPITVGTVAPLLIHAQPRPADMPLSFDVISIKASKVSGGASSGGNLPGGERYSATNISLGGLIITAYGVSPLQISAKTRLLAEKYDIEAKAEHPVTSEQMTRMLQSLLLDRFKLRLSRELKELPVYALVVGSAGPKIHQSHDGIGGIASGRGSGRGHFVAQNISMAVFAASLSPSVGRIVVDETRLPGTYDVDLTFSPPEPIGASDEAGGRGYVASTFEGSSIFNALQEQLGLKLEPKRAPVEFLVVDHVERPSPN